MQKSDIDIEELHIDYSYEGRLRKLGFVQISQLVEKSDEELLSIPRLGLGTLKQIRESLPHVIDFYHFVTQDIPVQEKLRQLLHMQYGIDADETCPESELRKMLRDRLLQGIREEMKQ